MAVCSGGYTRLDAIYLRRRPPGGTSTGSSSTKARSSTSSRHGNRYDLLRLQQAAVLHDRGQRKPWESSGTRSKRTNYTHVTDHNGDEDSDGENEPDDGIVEEVAEAWVTYQSAKGKYRSQKATRGYQAEPENPPRQPTGDGGRDQRDDREQGREARLRAMKAKSYSSGCGRKGHWHRDDACPLNRDGHQGKAANGPKSVALTNVLPAECEADKTTPVSFCLYHTGLRLCTGYTTVQVHTTHENYR